jgi:hypothetical protein
VLRRSDSIPDRTEAETYRGLLSDLILIGEVVQAVHREHGESYILLDAGFHKARAEPWKR